MAPANRDNRIGGLHHKDIPGMAKTGPDCDVEILVAVTGAGHDPYRNPAVFRGAPARGLHYPAKTTADQGFVLPCNEAAGHKSHPVLLLRRICGPDYRDLAHVTVLILCHRHG